jgi:hypothetical protein
MNDPRRAINVIAAEQVRHDAAQRLQSVVQALQMSVHEIERYHAKLAEARCDTERAKLLNWTVHYLVCCTVPNLRIDLLADSKFDLDALCKE